MELLAWDMCELWRMVYMLKIYKHVLIRLPIVLKLFLFCRFFETSWISSVELSALIIKYYKKFALMIANMRVMAWLEHAKLGDRKLVSQKLSN